MKTFAKQCKLCMLAFKGKPRKPRRPLHFDLVAFGITLARVRSKFEFQGGHLNTTQYYNLLNTDCHFCWLILLKNLLYINHVK